MARNSTGLRVPCLLTRAEGQDRRQHEGDDPAAPFHGSIV